MTESITAKTEVGTEFVGPAYEFALVRMLAFSGGPIDTPGWPAKNLHTDVEKAAEAGLPAPIASGIQYEGHLVELLVKLFGDAWFREGVLQTKYPRTVAAGDRVQPMVHVTGRAAQAGRVTFDLEVWCQRAGDEKVLVGTARCAVAADA